MSWLDSLALHPLLRERCRLAPATNGKALPEARTGSFVLYLPTVTLRGHDNPALDLAVALSARLLLPLLVHSQLSDRAPHATERRLVFELESLATAAAEFAARGCLFTLTVEKAGQRQQNHLTLAARAAVVVADEPFVEPHLSRASSVAAVGGGLR